MRRGQWPAIRILVFLDLIELVFDASTQRKLSFFGVLSGKTKHFFSKRTSSYLPHKKRVQSSEVRPRRGRIVWEDDDSMGAAVAPKGSFPWMVSLFVLLKNGEALFMCAGALITPNLAVTAAHCFTNNEKKTTW